MVKAKKKAGEKEECLDGGGAWEIRSAKVEGAELREKVNYKLPQGGLQDFGAGRARQEKVGLLQRQEEAV